MEDKQYVSQTQFYKNAVVLTCSITESEYDLSGACSFFSLLYNILEVFSLIQSFFISKKICADYFIEKLQSKIRWWNMRFNTINSKRLFIHA
jgi:hypothetical protein